MATIGIQINGLDKITKWANKFPQISRKYVDKAIIRSIGEIDRKTKPLTPVKTGRLKGSLVPIFRPFTGIYGSAIPYAAAVHNLYPAGTSFKNPSLNKRAVAGFLTVGVRESNSIIDTAFREALDSMVKEVKNVI